MRKSVHFLCVMAVAFTLFAPEDNGAAMAGHLPGAQFMQEERLVQADAAYEAGRFEEAAVAYAAVLRDSPDNERAAYQLGWCYNQLGRHAEALGPLKRSIELQPSNPRPYVELAFAYRGLGSRRDALSTLKTLLDAQPNSGGVHLTIGQLHNDLGEYDAALEALTEAARRQPKGSEAPEEMARAYEGLKDYEAAAASYRRAVELNRYAARPEKALGDLYLNSLGRPDLAVQHYRRALVLAPEDVALHYKLGSLLNALGNFTEALEPLEDAILLAPNFAAAYRQLAYTYTRLERLEEADRADKRGAQLEAEAVQSR